MKKILALILTIAMATMLFAGCTGGASQVDAPPQLQDPVSVAPSVVEAYAGEFYKLHTHEVTAVPYVEPIYTAKGGQKGGDQHTGDAQQVQIGQQTNDEHHDTLHDVHPHQHPFAAAFIHNAAAEGGQEHGHEHGDRGHDAHEAAGAGLLIDPVADGHAVHQVTDSADGAPLQKQDEIPIRELFCHRISLLSPKCSARVGQLRSFAPRMVS